MLIKLTTGRNNVLVTSGIPKQSTTPIPFTWLWDPYTGNIQVTTSFPSTDFWGAKMVRFSEYEVLVLSPRTNLIHSFTITDGWKLVTSLTRSRTQAIAPMLVPKGLFKCQSTV